jgi:hypothetical protein
MNGRLLPLRMTALVGVTMILTSCANGEGSGTDVQKSKLDGEAAQFQVVHVPGSVWSSEERQAKPAPTVCTFNGDAQGGVQHHWFIKGSAPSNPKTYIAAVGKELRKNGFTVQLRETDYGKYGTLYEAVARGESLPTVATSANAEGSTIMLNSVCVAGDAEKL